MVRFNKKWKKYNEIQLTKNIMDLNIRKMTNHPPSPGLYLIFIDINSTMTEPYGIGDAVLFLNHFVSSLYDEYLTS